MNAVSRSILDEIRPWVRDRPGTLNVLPNVISATRFTKANRLAKRTGARVTLGYQPHERVFLFMSQGHHRRKGFWLAVESVAIARQRGFRGARLHVVGGFPLTLKRLQSRLSETFPDWSEWLYFAGMISDSETHFAAADALLFPSYFEAFSLVEIEAAAMGLSLLLTPHHGSEMILKDGQNGRRLPFNAEGIADILIEGLQSGFPSDMTGESQQFALYEFVDQLKSQIEQVVRYSNLAPRGSGTFCER